MKYLISRFSFVFFLVFTFTSIFHVFLFSIHFPSFFCFHYMVFCSFPFSIIFSSSKVLNNSLFALWSFFRTFISFTSLKFLVSVFAIFQCFLFSLHLFFIVKLFFALKYLKFGSKSFYSSLFHRSRLSFFKVSIFHSGGLQTHLFFIFSFFLRFSLVFPMKILFYIIFSSLGVNFLENFSGFSNFLFLRMCRG